MSSSRTPRSSEILPLKWKELNIALHGLYGYSPDLTLHSNHSAHLAQLEAILSLDSTTEKDLIRNWKTKISGLINSQKKNPADEEVHEPKRRGGGRKKKDTKVLSGNDPLVVKNLSDNWETLNGQLHSLYGYGPEFDFVQECDDHLHHLDTLVSNGHPSKELINNWIDNIRSTLTEKEDLCIGSKNDLDWTENTPPPKKMKTTNDVPTAKSYPTPNKDSLKTGKRPSSACFATEPGFVEAKKGYDFDFANIASKPQYVTNLKGVKWMAQQSGKIMELQTENGNAAQTILFGKINRSLFGIYGDFNPNYHSNLLEGGNRWLTLKIIPVPGLTDEFVKQVDALQKIENMIDERFSESGPKYRAVKSPQEIQISRRLIGPVNKGAAFVPEDVAGRQSLKC